MINSNKSSLIWTKLSWIEQAHLWINAQLTENNIQIVEPIDQFHVRPWSTVMRITANGGVFYFKASLTAVSYEAKLTKLLSQWLPEQTPEVLAVNEEKGWLLLYDGGKQLRTHLNSERDLHHWATILPIYAQLQQALSRQLNDILSVGVPDRRLSQLPILYEELIFDAELTRLGLEKGISSEEHQRLIQLIPAVASLCQQLSSYQIPESLHHGDLHDANIFAENGKYIFFDWGDSSISHPFFSLRTAFVSIENSLKVEETSPIFPPLADKYLAPWEKYETKANVKIAFQLAKRLSPISSALVYHRILSAIDSPLRTNYSHAIPSLLKEFLENNKDII